MNTGKERFDTEYIERTLGLPTKSEEGDLFTNYDVIATFDRYLPLADYLLDEYACPNDDIRMIVEETMYTAVMMTMAKFRRMEMYKKDTTFTAFSVHVLAEFMDEFAKEGKVYKIEALKVI